MEQEPPQEFLGGHRHQPFLALVGIVFPAESDFALGKVYDPMVGDGDAMRVAGQVMQNMFGPAEWSFGVDHPIVTEQRSQKSMESLLFAEPFQTSGKQQLSVAESVLEAGNELASEYAAQNLDRQKERIPRVYPAGVVRGDPARWNNAVNVRMQKEVLPPGVQNTDRADPGAEVPWIGRDFQ